MYLSILYLLAVDRGVVVVGSARENNHGSMEILFYNSCKSYIRLFYMMIYLLSIYKFITLIPVHFYYVHMRDPIK